MKVFMILAHAEERSFNGALFDTAREVLREVGHSVQSVDPHKTGFDPVSDRSNGDIHGILRPIQRGILQFTAFDVLAPHIVHAPAHQTDAQRREALDAYAPRLRAVADEAPVDVGRYWMGRPAVELEHTTPGAARCCEAS